MSATVRFWQSHSLILYFLYVSKQSKNEIKQPVSTFDASPDVSLQKTNSVMTYREIFLQADPQAINDAIGAQEMEFRGRKVRYKTQQGFDICKGFKFYAQGMRLDVSKEEEVQKILNDDECEPQFKWTRKQAQVFVTAKRGWLSTACEVLGFNQASNPDESVNEWLNRTSTVVSDNVNQLAANIISILITDNLKRYERFKS